MGVDIHPPETEYDPYYILYILYILYLVYLSTVGSHDGLATHRTWAHQAVWRMAGSWSSSLKGHCS